MAIAAREGGKTANDGIAEVREAVDFLRYYADPRPRRFRRPGRTAGPDGGAQRDLAAWPRRLRLHQPLELPAGDLHRPGGRRAGRGQCRAGQARRTDPDHGGPRRAIAARGRHPRRRSPPAARRRRGGGCGAGRGLAHRRRRLHRRHRYRAHHQPGAGPARRPDHPADRRDRRPERDDRRFLRPAGTGGARRAGIRLPQRRPALLGAARAVPAGRHRRQDHRNADRRHARTQDSATRRCSPPISAR